MKTAHTTKATNGQKGFILRRLARRELMPRTLSAQDRTGVQWRPMFKLIGMPEPSMATGLTHWPTVDEFMDSLTMNQAHLLIAYLQD